MHLAYTPEQEELRSELRDYFAHLMTPELRGGLADAGGDYGGGRAYRQIVRQLGRDGWLALSWPAEYGGRGGPTPDPPIFTPEAAVAPVPPALPTTKNPGPATIPVGTPPPKERHLPPST